MGPRDARVRSRSLGRVASFHRGGGISGGGDSDCGWGVGVLAGGVVGGWSWALVTEGAFESVMGTGSVCQTVWSNWIPSEFSTSS